MILSFWDAGVPRVFPEHQLPASLQGYQGRGDEAWRAGSNGLDESSGMPTAAQVLATLQQCRVNVSVRHAAPQIAESYNAT